MGLGEQAPMRVLTMLRFRRQELGTACGDGEAQRLRMSEAPSATEGAGIAMADVAEMERGRSQQPEFEAWLRRCMVLFLGLGGHREQVPRAAGGTTTGATGDNAIFWHTAGVQPSIGNA